ncbi:hypothetical protein MAPG_10985 [Magnaporthiopsis poae ATCC 64411]|uniref:Uncharacterized protein n=1 Tax=Magnaporthiopsis poae (strain ATCC 64411 / 73-15) TaxID=644358 RepID=A0A0C4EE20_MAGP6|nr:hypothetical protein MAPG_10985 [Magnaporthiopsis poae ATCC 64411]
MQNQRTGLRLVQTLWPDIAVEEYRRSPREYEQLLEHVNRKLDAVDQNPNDAWPITADHVLWAIVELRRRTGTTRDGVVEGIGQMLKQRGETHSEDAILRLVGSAATLWLTTKVVPLPLGVGYGLDSVIQWDHDQSLTQLLGVSFCAPPPTKVATAASERLSVDLTMATLVSRHDFVLSWTSNLSEHLRVSQQPGSRHRVLIVYEHKVALRNHLRFRKDSCPFPTAVLEAALDTLNLLFPAGHRPTEALLRSHDPVYAQRAYDVAARQYELDLAQACADPKSGASLGRLCS